MALSDEIVAVPSVGVDIGSATMQMVFSELYLEQRAGVFVTVGSRIVRRSDVGLTPYCGDRLIDVHQVDRFIGGEFDKAGIDPLSIRSGAVILTGVALEQANARALAEQVSQWGGQFISMSAGDDMEGALAAHGSRAIVMSREHGRVLNVDIGGGTTKLTMCELGVIQSVSAVNIGTRLLAWDPGGRVLTRAEHAGIELARSVGYDLKLGTSIPRECEGAIAASVVENLTHVISGAFSPLFSQMRRGNSLAVGRPDVVVLSGGATEYMRGSREQLDVGDLGFAVALELKRLVEGGTHRVEVSAQGIRCTVVGAAQFTTQVSGLTVHRGSSLRLPLVNVPVSTLPRDLLDGDVLEPLALARTIANATRSTWSAARDSSPLIGIAFRWRGQVTHARVRALGWGISNALRASPAGPAGTVIICDKDIAYVLGRLIQQDMGDKYPLLVIDGIRIRDLHFVDLNESAIGQDTVSVTLKSLAFA